MNNFVKVLLIKTGSILPQIYPTVRNFFSLNFPNDWIRPKGPENT